MRRLLVVGLFCTITLLGVAMFSFFWERSIFLGEKARFSGELEIPLNGLVDLNELNPEDILQFRITELARYPQLIQGYKPDPRVYSALLKQSDPIQQGSSNQQSAPIQEGTPSPKSVWRSARSFALYGPPDKLSEENLRVGPSEDSVTLLNPLLLGTLFSFERSPYNPNFRWLPGVELSYPIGERAVPEGFHLRPSKLAWHAQERRVSIRYELKRFLEAQKELVESPSGELPARLAVLLHNARDLGFRFGFPNLENSPGIALDEAAVPDLPQEIFSRVTIRTPCSAVELGCYTLKGMPKFTQFVVESLPARYEILLWSSRPKSSGEAPDLVLELALL